MKTILFNIALVLGLFMPVAHAGDIEFTASAPTSVVIGQQFRLTFSINANASGFTPPDLSSFYVLSGPNPSSNTSMQIINGRMSRSVSKTYTYYLQAKQEGSFTIGPAEIKAEGVKYSTNPIKIFVTATGNKGNRPQANAKKSTSANISNKNQKNVFLLADINKKELFQGEQLILTYKLYTRLNISNYKFVKAPSSPGFWSQDLLESQNNIPQYKEVVKGQEYLVAEISKQALFPLKTGKLSIKPSEVEITARVRSQNGRNSRDPFFDSFFDDPFFGGYQNIQEVVKAEDVSVKVMPLPEEGKPERFYGAVGQFSVKASIDKTNVKTNDAITLRYTIWGNGSLKLIETPAILFPPDFDVYDPKVSNKINKNNKGISGAKTIEYLIIPRTPGDFKIPSLEFSYFDPLKKSFVDKKTEAFNIHVEKGEMSDDEANTYRNFSKEDIQYIGNDIRYINTKELVIRDKDSIFLGSGPFLMILTLSAAGFCLIILIWKLSEKRHANTHRMRTRKARKMASGHLKKSARYLKEGNENEFYISISQALWGYISDKFNIPLASLSAETVSTHLKGKNIPQEIIDEFLDTLNKSDYSRFAPGDKNEVMDQLYKQALDIISKTERGIK